MDDHPKGEKQLAKERSPRLVSAVDSVGDPGDHSHQVDDEESRWRDEEGRPFEHVELGKVTVFIRGLGGDSEVCVNAGEHFEQTLEDSKEMGGDTPMTQNCSFLHHSSIPTPLHLISRIPVAKMEIKRDMNQILAILLICDS